MSSTIPHILFTELPAKHGRIGQVLLNRPQSLNALSTEIVVDLNHKLHQWANDPEIFAVIIRGVGERAFCAGGDLKEFYFAGKEKHEMATPFFRQEYRLNEYISKYPKPYIPMLHGISMGGGLGISMHGTHIVAASDLKLAMPETAIGFYPDTGGSFFLSHVPHYIGMYLGLTGNSINVHDAIFCGLVDQYVPQKQFDALTAELCNSDFSTDANAAVTQAIEKFKVTPNQSELQQQLTTIERCFSKDSVADILTALESENTNWAQAILATLNKRSPTSLKVTHRLLTVAKDLDITACMELEFNLTKRMLQENDIYEGIRAVLIDKTHDPKWQPSRLQDVNDKAIADMFELTWQL